MRITLDEMIKASGGEYYGSMPGTHLFESIKTDSRKIEEGDVYLAIKGENFDGHDFIEDAIKQGAPLVVAADYNKVKPMRQEVLLVKDTVIALGEIAKAYKSKINKPLIGITGSVGKTTTKDIISAALSSQHWVHKTKGNFNNEIGLPLTLLDVSEKTDVIVLEMGMWAKGEIKALTEIAKPDIAAITNIGISHIERLKTQEAIFEAKMEIVEGLSEKGLLVVNGDDPFLSPLSIKDFPRIIKVGFKPQNDLCAKNLVYKGLEGMAFDLEMEGETHNISIPMLGEHNVINALIAIAVATEMGMTLSQIQKGLLSYRPSESRMTLKEKKGINFIDDAYNSSPDSALAGLKFFSQLKVEGNKIVILGDMLELGTSAERGHDQVLEASLKYGFDYIFVYGELMTASAYKRLDPRIKTFKEHKEMAQALHESSKKGDMVYLKGSRGMTMEKIIDLF